MKKFDGWSIGSMVVGVIAGLFGIAKGIHDVADSQRKQEEMIDKSVAKYLSMNSHEPNSEV